MIPHKTPFFLPLLYPSLLWRVPTSENEIYLTFDDGPIPGPTEFVLDELHQSKISSTFFCIGDNVRKHPEVFKRIIRDGHGVGNHTFHHLNGWSTNARTYFENIEQFDNTVKQHGKDDVKLFRPPYGRITRKQISLLASRKIVMWDVLTFDYDKSISPEKCLRKSIAATGPGSIIIFHDSLKAERNMKYVLPRFVEHFGSKGFTFKSLES
jgi:peptidoglycan-N-acetylglucosamine deacetylase